MHALRMSEVKVQREIAGDLLLELYVRRVDSGIGVILTKDAHRGPGRNTSRRRYRLYAGPGRWLGGSAKAGKSETGVTKNSELLHAVVGDRSDLRQHILPPIENSIAGPQN